MHGMSVISSKSIYLILSLISEHSILKAFSYKGDTYINIPVFRGILNIF
jgi:hypothetical protein